MRIVIAGCGRVGSALAVKLEQAGHEVTVIDQDSQAFSRLPDEFRGSTIVGTGIDEDVLRKAGTAAADAFAAVMTGDNRNIMAAQVAMHTFHVPQVVARIYDPMRAAIYRTLGVNTMCPTLIGADLIAKDLLSHTAPE